MLFIIFMITLVIIITFITIVKCSFTVYILRHIFFYSLIPSFLFFTPIKRLGIRLRPSDILDVVFLYLYLYLQLFTQKQPFIDIQNRCYSKQVFLARNFTNLTGKYLCWGATCNFIKKRLQHGCFPMKSAKLLRTSFFTEHFRWLLMFTLPYLTYLLILIYTCLSIPKSSLYYYMNLIKYGEYRNCDEIF